MPGRLLEEDDQAGGLAHVVEHMAFKTARAFPSRDIATSAVDSAGVRGPGVNARMTGSGATTKGVLAADLRTDRPRCSRSSRS